MNTNNLTEINKAINKSNIDIAIFSSIGIGSTAIANFLSKIINQSNILIESTDVASTITFSDPESAIFFGTLILATSLGFVTSIVGFTGSVAERLYLKNLKENLGYETNITDKSLKLEKFDIKR